jgi:uncharacterized protein YyaL (SSP411 family)
MKESDAHMSANKRANRLIHEKSPYLLQHAYNPVDWYPWSDEVFEKAKSEDKPIFLSIGYSTCHWCHVMERESFEDEEVAAFLNKHFVSIKVDREERPDIDHIYMEVCQALTGHGGWPLTAFIGPDKKPFFAGTYFPKNDRMGMMGFMSLLKRVNEAWENNRDALVHSGEKIASILNQPSNRLCEKIPDDIFHFAFKEFKSDFDSVYGGFGGAPKFPTPHNIFFLLRYWHFAKESLALEMVEKTLDSMHRGGIYDHIGFGFSRYSTDRKWLVPHFEKMLYDNALLAIAYLETYQATSKQKYARIAEQIFTYVLRNMTSPEGGFYSAEDADSEGEEGKFYVWTPEEVLEVLGAEEGSKFCTIYDITSNGNFEGKNIPNLIRSSIPEEETEFVNQCRIKLFQHREKRVHPHKDDKILTSWNSLMIAAFAIGGRYLNDGAYIDAAEKALEFILTKLVDKDGRLLARYREGESAYPAYVDDYPFLIWSLIELYESTYKPFYLQKALEFNHSLLKLFWDNSRGGLFLYGNDSEQLIARPKNVYDGAIPSGNSVAALNFLRLARLTGRYHLEEKAEQQFRVFGSNIINATRGSIFLLTALLFSRSPAKEVIIVEDAKGRESSAMLKIIREGFRPFTLSLFYSEQHSELKDLVPFLAAYKPINEKTTAYICEKNTCQAPITDINEFRQAILD